MTRLTVTMVPCSACCCPVSSSVATSTPSTRLPRPHRNGEPAQRARRACRAHPSRWWPASPSGPRRAAAAGRPSSPPRPRTPCLRRTPGRPGRRERASPAGSRRTRRRASGHPADRAWAAPAAGGRGGRRPPCRGHATPAASMRLRPTWRSTPIDTSTASARSTTNDATTRPRMPRRRRGRRSGGRTSATTCPPRRERPRPSLSPADPEAGRNAPPPRVPEAR